VKSSEQKYQPYALTDRRIWYGRLAATPGEAMALAYGLRTRVAQTKQELVLIGVTRVDEREAT
jgi:hypothetical protein